jgi:haloalkane dehalogenase
MSESTNFAEHRVATERGVVYARDYAGSGPTFVLMHGFPDNLGIYDALVSHLVTAGRRVVTFDFLGFGRSDKPACATYSFANQLKELAAVVDALDLGPCVPVAHDSSGAAAINYALADPSRVAGLVMLNSAYDDAVPILWPELITLFATKSLGALAAAIGQGPAQFGWILGWQQEQFSNTLPADQRARFGAGIGQLIADNFTIQPSSGPAFMQLAAQFFEELASNTKRLPELKILEMPVKVIWGELDPYITADVARDRGAHLKSPSLHLLPAGHWLQAELPERVAKEMLA